MVHIDFMLQDSPKLTPMQSEFVRHLTSGVNPTASARLAGYSCPEVQGFRLKHTATVQSALQKHIESLFAAAADTAARFMINAVTDNSYPHETRRKCAQWVLDKTKNGVEKQSSTIIDDLLSKPASELTFTELLAVSAHTQEQLANLNAIPVQVADGKSVKPVYDKVTEK